MNGLWIISHVVLWLIVIGLGLMILALSREIEALHSRLDSLQKHIFNDESLTSKSEQIENIGENQPSIAVEIQEFSVSTKGHEKYLLARQVASLIVLIVLVLPLAACTFISGQTNIPTLTINPEASFAAFSATTASPTIQPTSSITISATSQPTLAFTASPAISTTEGAPVSKINQLIPKISPASEIIDTANISSVFLEQASPTTIALDDQYVYWVDQRNPGFLYRISQSGGQPEVAAKSLYADGRLDCLHLQTSGHWMIFCDTSRSKDLTKWKIRAINLDDLSQSVLLSDHSENNEKNLITYFDISLNGNSVIWVITKLKNDELDENVVTSANLDTGEIRETLHKKADTSIWSLITLSGNQAVIEQDFDETQGGKSALHLLDLINGNLSDLSIDGQCSMPDFSFPWVICKAGARYDFMHSLVIYDLEEDQQSLISSVGAYPLDPSIDGSRIYWSVTQKTDVEGNAIYIYDIEKNTTYVLDTPGPYQWYKAITIRGNTIAWIRNPEFSQRDHDAYIEWAKIH